MCMNCACLSTMVGAFRFSDYTVVLFMPGQQFMMLVGKESCKTYANDITDFTNLCFFVCVSKNSVQFNSLFL